MKMITTLTDGTTYDSIPIEPDEEDAAIKAIYSFIDDPAAKFQIDTATGVLVVAGRNVHHVFFAR